MTARTPARPKRTPKRTPAELLAEALEFRGVSQAELARRLGRDPSTVNHWLTERNKLGIEDCALVADALEIRAPWLAYEDGPMLDPKDAPDAITTVPPPERVSTPPPQPPARALPSPERKRTRAA